MTEIMKCQMCVSKGFEGIASLCEDDHGENILICEDCYMTGPTNTGSTYWVDGIYGQYKKRQRIVELADGDLMTEIEVLAEHWNRVQQLIARGLLLEDCEVKKSRSL